MGGRLLGCDRVVKALLLCCWYSARAFRRWGMNAAPMATMPMAVKPPVRAGTLIKGVVDMGVMGVVVERCSGGFSGFPEALVLCLTAVVAATATVTAARKEFL